MKKFVIISVILLLIGGGVFGFSLWHYIDSRSVAEPVPTEAAPIADPASEQATAAADPVTPAPSASDVFAAGYDKANAAVENMSREQMVGQVLMGVCSDMTTGSADLAHYNLAGYLLEGAAFSYKSADEIKEGLAAISADAAVAPILAVTEEGGEKCTVSNAGGITDKSYDSPRNILASGGIREVEKTELDKATFLHDLGINLNLAPVVDMPNAYDQIMYTRSLSDDVNTVSDFARYCAKHVQAKGVSVALKHFPGYGTIPDSAASEAQANGTAVIDTRDADTIRNTDYAPFKAGVDDGAHFVLMSNVVVKSIDATHTAALSSALHQELRQLVGFSGIAVTDIIDDGDYSAYADGKNVAVAAILAGNDIVIARDYRSAYNAILAAVNDGTIGEDILKQACTRVLAYKYTAGLIK